jgi:hypothetical protein
VKLKSTKGVLSVDDFIFVADGNGGEQLAELRLSDDGAAAAQAGLKFTAKRAPGSTDGDGLVHVGFIDATDVDLRAISVSGDLGRIVAGDTTLKTPALASLKVGSIGAFGLAPQGSAGSLDSSLSGAIGKVTVRGDVVGASLDASSKIGSVAVGGDIVDTVFTTPGSIARLTVGRQRAGFANPRRLFCRSGGGES